MRVACVQISPQADMAANIEAAMALARTAVDDGARLVLLPEYAFMLHASGRAMRDAALDEANHPGIASFATFAREHDAHVLLGSVTVTTDEARIANRSLLISPRGEVIARYDKIHMFDATLPSGRSIRESSTYRPGGHAVLAKTPLGPLGLSICYDLRFPHLYRVLAQAGAQALLVPSAFTRATGELHWHALLRARAIENGCFVFAPATCGTHPGDHATYGHSLIVAPSGEILADAGEAPGLAIATLDLGLVAETRGRLASLSHDRPFDVVAFGATTAATDRSPA